MTLEPLEIEYNRDLKSLEDVLSRLKRHGDFFVAGAMEVPMPKVDVDGAGTLSFPVPEAQIGSLLRHAQRAPYGKGEKTVTDSSVRKVWQIDPDKVRVGGKSWAATFEAMLSKVRAGLGCDGVTVAADLYKLLVYDQGGFFLPHRDTEKTDGMFGTLVVTLPSQHRGGELRIRHAGREVTVDTSTAEFSELSYAAFYADCEHEAMPVRDGNRVCLIYNLIQKPGKRKARKLEAPEYESEIAKSAAILERAMRTADAPAKIVWLLAHQYSPAGLSFSALKAADAAKVGVLVQAAARAQCVAHLGIVHIHESGAAEPDYDAHSYGSRWNRYRDDDEGEEEDESDGDFAVVTVDDTVRYIDEWRDTSDLALEFGPIPLADGELLPAGALDGEPPDHRKLMEASGNEGASYERSYHRAVLVLWRQDRHADVLLQAGVVAGLPYLKQLMAAGKRARADAISLAERMVDAWPADSSQGDSYFPGCNRPQASHRIKMIRMLGKLDSATLSERFIADAVTPAYDGSENAALVSSVDVLGGIRAASVISGLMAARMPDLPHECAELLLALSDDPSRCFPEVAESAVIGLDRIVAPNATPKVLRWTIDDDRRPLGPQFLEHLLQALRRMNSGTQCLAAAERIAARPETFDPVTLVVPALDRIHATWGRKAAASDSSVEHLWTRSAEFLLRRSEAPPPRPADWRLDVRITCSCPDCRELKDFAFDPIARVHRFRIKKERRQHLHNAIDDNQLDMTHITERVGSPQTLVCTKDRRTFENRMKQYGHELAVMRTLVRLAPGSDAARRLSARMQAAVRLAG